MDNLTIQKIDVFQLNLPYSNGTYTISGARQISTFDATIVRITTNTGLEGWGESTPFGSTYIASHALGVRAGIAEIAPKVIGLDPRRVDRINDAMDAALTGHEHAKTALDVACWDIFGKATGLPVCELLGGRTDVKMSIISSVPIGDPASMRETVASHRAKGYKSHSVKIDGNPALDAERVAAALADRQPGEYYTIDANSGLSVETALRFLRLVPKDLDFVFEAPCATMRENLSLRKRTSIPIIFDELATSEASIIELIANDAADGIGLKISKTGGLTRGRRQRDICIAAGYTMTVAETTGSDIAFAAIVHLGQTVPARNLRSVLECRDMVTVKTADGEFGVVDGCVTAPEGPGLGVTPRLDVLGDVVASYS